MKTPLKVMNNRFILYNYHSVLYLLRLCDLFKDYELGLKCITKLEEEYKEKLIKDNIDISYYSDLFKKNIENKEKQDNKLLYFIIDGGWKEWNGIDYENGIGGSETFVIKYSETLAKFGYKVFVFCKTNNYCFYNNVLYIPIIKIGFYYDKIKPRVCFVNRYSEYVSVCNHFGIDSYFISHDLFRENEIIPDCKGVLTISKWHYEYTKEYLKSQKSKNKVYEISYGIEEEKENKNKIKNSFIYSSFPNRGLYYLLKMFPIILENFKDSTLNIFCDFENEYVQMWYKNETEEMKKMIKEINEKYGEKIKNHGWVNKKKLREYYLKSEYWFYPCIFIETCCHTAMECAITKTLAITNNLGALQNTVGDRGIIINGDAREEGWQYLALNRVLNVMKGLENKELYLEKNYNWAIDKSYENVVKDFENRFIDLE
jgi:hypothetical protein